MNLDVRRGLGAGVDTLRQPNGQAANPSLVLIVCSSPINRIVVSRIVEQTGLKAVCEIPQNVAQALSLQQPGLVILDCGTNHEEYHAVAPAIVDHRRASGGSLPLLIVLSAKGLPADSAFVNIADAVIAKPITPDALQPKIEQLVEDARR